MIADCTGLILAGGDSRRMGRDKAMLEFDGKTLLDRTVDLMQSLFPQVLLSVRRIREGATLPQVVDDPSGGGPLAGLCAGLAHSRTPWVFATAVDMPFLCPGLIRELSARRGHHEAVVPVAGGVLQPLAAYYATSALPSLRAALAEPGARSLRGALERLDVLHVREERSRAFIDLDTPEDVATARIPEAKMV
jgi:molybdopterin-guanine dinucleotide biosynthesis protein A